MTLKIVRIVGRCEDRLDYPFYIDAPVDESGMIVTKAWLFGFMGKTLGNDLNPFIGRIDKDEPSPRFPFLLDYGTDFSESDRYYWTNLPLKRVRKGEQFTIRMPSEADETGYREWIYEIRDLIDKVTEQEIDGV